MIGNRSTQLKNSAESFAICHISSGSDGNLRSSGRLQFRPYFGHFSGMWIDFDVRKNLSSAGNHKIKIKIEGCQDSSIHLRLRAQQPSLDLTKSVTRSKLKDLCLQYIHAIKSPNLKLQHGPKSLAFLCEKIILLNLNEINSSVLPPVSFSHLKPSTFLTQDVIIKVWFGSSSCPTKMERMKIRQGISVAELQWMLCNKLPGQIEPSKLDIYEYKSMEKLSESSYLTPKQVIFHCVAMPSTHRDSIILSLIGHGIEKIDVEPCNTTLNQFQNAIKQKFGLQASSYIFLPQIDQSKKISHVAMSAVLDKSTLSLIDSRRRNLPIVDSIPLTLLKYDQLDMYKMTLSELNLFSANIVHAYEVTGPTIPISYRTSTSVGRDEYALISDCLHVVSINLTWSIRTLLKYIEEISHFPCEDIDYKGSILPHTSLLHQYFTNSTWKTKGKVTDHIEFIDNVPKIVNSSSKH